MKRPAAICCFVFCAGCFAANLLPTGASLWLGALCAVGAVALIIGRRLVSVRALPLVTAALGAAFLYYFIFFNAAYADVLAVDQSFAVARGRVREPSQAAGDYFYTTVTLTEGDIRGETVPLRGDLRVYTEQPVAASAGDGITVQARLSIPRSDGGYDTARGMRAKGVYYSAFVPERYIEVQPRGDVFFLTSWLEAAREYTNAALEANVSGGALAMAKGVLLGDKSLLTSGQIGMFRTTGMSHVLSVSGMHVSLLAAFALMLFRLVRIPRRAACALSACVALGFTALVGFTPSATRAGIMAVIMYAGMAMLREADTLTSLSVSVALICALNPFSAMDVGLQLSLAATLGIVLASGPMKAALTRRLPDTLWARALKSAVITPLCVTLTASLFTYPVTALIFREFSLVGPVSNILCSLVVTVLFISALCVAALSLLPFLPACAALVVSGAEWYMDGVLGWLSRLPLASVWVGYTFMGVWLAGSAGLAALWLCFRKCGARAVTAVACSALLLGIGLLSYTLPRVGWLSFAAVDVGQGDSLVFTLGGRAIVVDCGSMSRSRPEDDTRAYLKRRGVTVIDALILTHYDSDHVKGAVGLMDYFSVRSLLLPGYGDEELKPGLMQAAYECGIDVVELGDNAALECWQELTLYIYIGSECRLGDGEGNELSTVVLADYKGSTFLLTGDLGFAGERALMDTGLNLDADILKVGHHGSRFASGADFLDVVTPLSALISVGADNSYGHPTAEALERIAAHTERIFRTDTDYTVEYFTRGGGEYLISAGFR